MPERRIIYEALHAGTPLVFTSPVAPPLRLLSWDGVAIEAGASLWHGAEPLPPLRSHDVQRALAHYDKWMASFEAARAPFAVYEGDSVTLLNVHRRFLRQLKRHGSARAGSWCRRHRLNERLINIVDLIRPAAEASGGHSFNP